MIHVSGSSTYAITRNRPGWSRNPLAALLSCEVAVRLARPTAMRSPTTSTAAYGRCHVDSRRCRSHEDARVTPLLGDGSCGSSGTPLLDLQPDGAAAGADGAVGWAGGAMGVGDGDWRLDVAIRVSSRAVRTG